MTLYEIPGDAEINRGLIGYFKLDDMKAIPRDGIVAHYKLNDNAADTVVIDSKTGVNGVCSANTDTISGAGKINETLVMAETENIEVSNINVADIFSGSCTIAFWVNGAISTATFPKVLNCGKYGNNGWTIETGQSGEKVNMNFANGTGWEFLSEVIVIATDTWTHIAFSYDKTSQTITRYKNGIVDGTVDDISSYTFSPSSESFIIGGVEGQNSNSNLDDIRFYKKSLSITEILKIVNSGTGTEITDLFDVAIDYANFKDGVITDGANAAGINGLNTNALDFNGSTSKVVSSSVPNVTEGSVSLWFKKDSSVATDSNLINFDTSHLEIDFSNSKVRGIFEDTVTLKTTDSIDDVKQGVWQHVVFTWKENDFAKLYVDGIFNGQSVITTYYNNGPLIKTTIGWLSSADFFEGQIQNVRTYDRVLTAGEASKLHRLKL